MFTFFAFDINDVFRLVPVFFKLFLIPDKELRKTMYIHMVSNIRKISRKSQYTKTLRFIQDFLFKTLKNENLLLVKKSMDMIVSMFQKRIWFDFLFLFLLLILKSFKFYLLYSVLSYV